MEDKANELVLSLIQASASDLVFTTNALIDSLTERAERAEATVGAIRNRIEELLAGAYAPTDAALLRALYPRILP